MIFRYKLLFVLCTIFSYVPFVGSKSAFTPTVSFDSSIQTISYTNFTDEPPGSTAMHVRVLLEEKVGLNPAACWRVGVRGKMVVVDLENEKCFSFTDHLLVHDTAQGLVVENSTGKRLKPLLSVRVQTGDGYFTLNDRCYQGTLYFFKRNATVFVINNLELEDYLFSVLNSEGCAGWSLEVNKVFAVACRTYVINKVAQTCKKNGLYHIRNSTAHQRYDGYHKNQNIKQAVAQTQGIFLACKNRPILAMFDICCGGIVPSKMSGVDFKQAPYLARPYACTYCSSYPVYSWQARCTIDQFEYRLKKDFPALKKCKDMTIVSKDGAGVVKELCIKASSGCHSVSGKKIYSIVDGVKSFCYSVKKRGSQFVFDGRGYGHHLGLCQWGARKMAEKGWSYKDILLFYYPGTQFLRLV